MIVSQYNEKAAAYSHALLSSLPVDWFGWLSVLYYRLSAWWKRAGDVRRTNREV